MLTQDSSKTMLSEGHQPSQQTKDLGIRKTSEGLGNRTAIMVKETKIFNLTLVNADMQLHL
jgi:hypothetical protein